MFQPVSIPLASGMRDDIPSDAAETPAQLELATDVQFTRRGSLKIRPGTVLRGAQVQQFSQVLADIPTAVGSSLATGIVPVRDPGGFGEESPMALYAGTALVRRNDVWLSVGTPVCARQTKSVALASKHHDDKTSLHNPAPCGTRLVGALSSNGGSLGYPFVNPAGAVDYLSSDSVSTLDNAGKANIAAAAHALFYTSTTGNLYMALHTVGGVVGNLPATSVGTGADTTATPKQNVAAVINDAASRYFVAYASSTAGRITLLMINASTGAVVQTLNVNGLGTVQGLALAYTVNSSTDTIVLVWNDIAAGLLKSKVYTSNGTVFTDSAIDLSFATAPSTATYATLTAGRTTNSAAVSVTYLTSTNGSLKVTGRSVTAATEHAATFTLHGRQTSVDNGTRWEPLFGAVVVGGRTLIGVQRAAAKQQLLVNGLKHRAQWMVLDCTRQYTSGITTTRSVVAFGQVDTADRICPSQADTTSITNGVVFAIQDGVSFDLTGTVRSNTVRVSLVLEAPSIAHGHGNSVLGSTGGYVYDGSLLTTSGFAETFPYIHDDSATVAAAGTLAAGSYTYQTTWEVINARGQVVRSGASEPVTFPTVAANDKVNIVTTVPQLREYLGPADTVRVRLWATEVNPTDGAALYLVTETALTAAPTADSITLAHTAPVSTSAESLYTGDNAYDDVPPPAGDRGAAFALERLWVADQATVFASKLLRPGVAPAWSSEDTHKVQVPTSLGAITGLAGYEDRLIVVCTSGVALLRGPGFDDFGDGPGWAVDVVPSAPGAGMNFTVVKTPRTVVTTPEGAVFEARNRGLYIVSLNGVCEEISRPLSSSLDFEAMDGDVSYAPPATPGPNQSSTGTAKLFHGQLTGQFRYFDVTNGAWATWSSATAGRWHCTVNGVLWVQTDTAVASLDGPGAADGWNETFTTSVAAVSLAFTTKSIKVADSPQGWGRLRKALVHGTNPLGGTPPVVTMIIRDVATGGNILNDSETWPLSVADGLWPFTTAPEFWSAIQRCASVQVAVTITNATNLEITHLELWIDSTGAQAPNNVRS